MPTTKRHKEAKPNKLRGGRGNLSTAGEGVHPPTPAFEKTGTSQAYKTPVGAPLSSSPDDLSTGFPQDHSQQIPARKVSSSPTQKAAPSTVNKKLSTTPEPERNLLILRPQEGPQEEFLMSPEDEILFGGSKGGGKSFALILAALRQTNTPGYKAIIFRRTYPKLSELIDRAHQFFPFLGAKWMAKEYKWLFPSGATVRFAHCQNEEDKYIYQGHEYHFMGFDQLEEFTESIYMFLVAQVRNPPPNVFKQIVATANPGGIGHAWVYRRFMVDPVTNEEIPPGHIIKERFALPFDIGRRVKGDLLTRTRVFIPANVYDNKILLENDPNYLTNLMQLPEQERKALLEGDWHVFAGQYFKEWSAQRHVIDPIEIPPNWIKFRCMDFGSTAPLAFYWCAVDELGNVYVYREYYKAGYTARQHAQQIIALEPPQEQNTYAFTSVDPSIFSKSGQDYSIAEVMMEEGLNGIEPASNDRLPGWQELRWRLSYNDATNKNPSIFFFRNCINAIRTIPGLIHDDRRPEDLNSDGEDHAADAIRYGLMRLRDNKARERDITYKNQTGTRFGLPITTWQQAEEFHGHPHPYQHL